MAEQPRLAVATELRLVRTPDGVLWAPGGFGHDHWARVLDGGFSSTLVLARTEPGPSPPAAWEPMEGPQVSVVSLPPLRPGPALVRELPAAVRRFRAVADQDALLLVMPGIVAATGLWHARRRKRRFAVQVVGDPIAVAFSAHVGGPVGKGAGVVLAALQRQACRRAAVASYVTERHLQARYPPGPQTRTVSLSDVRLEDRSTGDLPAPSPSPRARPATAMERLITVGSLEQPYKRVDLAIEALAVLRAEGWDLTLDVVGDGRCRADLEALVAERGLTAAVTFHGQVTQSEVATLLSRSDAFVLCSDTEGMPRSLLEAMAQGLLCIGSSVGGTTELLPPEARFTAGSLPALVGTLRRHLLSPSLRSRGTGATLTRARDFRPAVLDPIRQALGQEIATTARAGQP